jgi:hypothetical protein
MNRRIPILVGILAVLLPLCASADVLEIPLALTGPDNTFDLETTDFMIGAPMAAVTQIALRLEGSYQEIMCVGAFDPLLHVWRPAFLDMYPGDDVAVESFADARHQFPESSGRSSSRASCWAGIRPTGRSYPTAPLRSVSNAARATPTTTKSSTDRQSGPSARRPRLRWS